MKRLENGRWGSKELCDLELWSEIPWVGPVWHFVLSEKNNNKLFIATGTGMVPIYAMIEKLSLDSYPQKIWLLYGNRSQSENYFTQEFWDLWKNIPNFEFLSCLSWENIIWFTHGRVTTLLTLEMIQKYDEFYICWSPAMVDDVKNILEQNNVKKENIFFEKY